MTRRTTTGYRRYLTDNPFRLLAVEAATPYRELAQRSRAVTHAARVGLGGQPALAEMLGDEELENCASIVRSLASDPARLTLYRLFWPLALPLAGELQSAEDLRRSRADASQARAPEDAQREFACDWCLFELDPSLEALEAALAAYDGAFGRPGLHGALARLLTAEGVTAERAEAAVLAASEDLVKWLRTSVAQHAAEALEPDAVRAGLLLARAAQSHPWGPPDDRLVELVGRCADQLAEEVDGLTQALKSWLPEYGTELPAPVGLLQQLVDVVESSRSRTSGGDADRTRRWRRARSAYVTHLGTLMREYALQRGGIGGDSRTAYNVLLLVSQLPLEGQLRELVDHDLRRYQALVRLEARAPQVRATPARQRPAGSSTGPTARSAPEPPRAPPTRPGTKEATSPRGDTRATTARAARPVSNGPTGLWHRFWQVVLGVTLIVGLWLTCWPGASPHLSGFLYGRSPDGSGARRGAAAAPDPDAVARRARLESERARVRAAIAEIDGALDRAERSQAAEATALPRQRASLRAAGEELKQDRSALEEQQARLDRERRRLDPGDGTDVSAFNERVDEFNLQLSRLEARARRHEEESAEYARRRRRYEAQVRANGTRRRIREMHRRRLAEIEAALQDLHP